MVKVCIHCGDEFNPHTYHKQRVGGKITECPDCVEELGTETAVPYLGVCMGEGKQGGPVSWEDTFLLPREFASRRRVRLQLIPITRVEPINLI